MKKLLIAGAALLICTPAFAHTTGSATHHKAGIHRHNTAASGTVGMSRGMHRRGALPDASGQGGSGPGSDQGGTRVAPGTMK
jgi:hypothetical protein